MIPSVIGPISPSNPPNGIIHTIRTNHGISNPVTEGIIKPTALNTDSGSINNVVLSSGDWATTQTLNPSPFFQLEFPNRFLFLSAYSMKGISNTGWCCQSKWRIEGFNKENEGDSSKWTLLGRNTSSEKNFCGDSSRCSSNEISTYSVIVQSKGFRYIRWTSEDSYCGSSYCRFVASGMEVYGTLSTSSLVAKTRKKCSCLMTFSRPFFPIVYTFIIIA